jgi:hypothetical protein
MVNEYDPFGDEPSLGGSSLDNGGQMSSGGRGLFGGRSRSGGRSSEHRARFSLDTSALSRLDSALDRTSDRLRRVGDMAQRAARFVSAVARAEIEATREARNSNSGAPGGQGGFFTNMRGGFSGGGGGGAGGYIGGRISGTITQQNGYEAMGRLITQAISTGVGAIDRRTDSAYPKMLANDRLAVLFQQTQGITQQQYVNQYRDPMRDYRLGAGGINTLLGLQAQTGINAQKMASSVGGLRAAFGYAYSTEDMAQMMRTLASPQVNNRLTMTLGTGLYGPGGSQRTPTQVIQQIVRGAGLTNERLVNSGLQPGSMTRARLSAMGVPVEMQDMVLQYAQENLQFQKKTGGKQGMYNPENQAQRKTMGIEGNFATQNEETTRLMELRDEKFYNRQKDNYAALERNTQALVRFQTAMEETMSGLIGARISNRGAPWARIGKGILGAGMVAGGIALGIGTSWTGVGGAAGFGIASAGIGTLTSAVTGGDAGDPVEGGTGTRGMLGGKSMVGAAKLNGMNATFKQRLSQMMQDNPNVKINQGFRSSSEQRQLFFSRYTRSNDPTGVFWNGSYWKKNSNSPDAAPPGMSMHEVGLAADLMGDIEWVQKNAHKYGLKTFSNVNEPWHIQPAELPNSRREYESLGAPWGRTPGAESFDPRSTFNGRANHSLAEGLKHKGMSRGITSAMLAARSGGGGAFGRQGTVVTSRKRGNLSKGVPSASEIPAGFMFRTTESYGGFGYYVPKDFTDADLEALHRREQPTWYVGPVKNSHGTFYGGFSMNDYNWNRAKAGLAKQGINTSGWGAHANDTIQRQKMAAEWLLEKASAHNGWEPIVRGTVDWPGVGRLPSVPMNIAPGSKPTTTHSSQSGDPITPMRGGGGGTTIIDGGGITIAPQIYIQSAGNYAADAHHAASEVAKIMARDLKNAAMRSA